MVKQVLFYAVVTKKYFYDTPDQLNALLEEFQDDPIGSHLNSGVGVLRGGDDDQE